MPSANQTRDLTLTEKQMLIALIDAEAALSSALRLLDKKAPRWREGRTMAADLEQLQQFIRCYLPTF